MQDRSFGVSDSFFDDSSAHLGLTHSHDGSRQRVEREAYILEFDIRGKAARLTAYYHALGMRKSDAEEMAVERYLRLAAGVYERIWRYLDRGHDFDAAVLSAEAELEAESDIADEPLDDESRERAAKDPYLGASLEDLMDVHKPTNGGGSKSKSRSSLTKPDPTVVAQALIRDMPR